MVGTAMWMTTGKANFFLASLFFAAVPQTLDSRLIDAARQGQAGSVKALIEAGADVNLKDQSGRTALTHALSGGHEEAVKMLKEAGAR